MTQQIRIITYVAILIFVLLLGWLGVPKREFVPRGLFLPTSTTEYAAVPAAQVQVSNNGMVPGTMIGKINAEFYTTTSTDISVAAIEKYVVNLAAAHGANHLVITGIFRDPSDSTLHFFGKAVKS